MLSEKEICLRVGLAFIAGALIGLDRESHGRSAGLRTTVLVCVAAALGIIFSEQLLAPASMIPGAWRPDPGRLAAGMLTGMGFLGAGSIMRQENVVRGVTTAAMLWYITVLGLAFGGGQFSLGLIGLAIALVVLIAMSALEKHIKSDWYGRVSIHAALEGPSEDEMRKAIEEMGVIVTSLDLEYDVERKQRTVCFEVRTKPADVSAVSQLVVKHFAKEPTVLLVKWM